MCRGVVVNKRNSSGNISCLESNTLCILETEIKKNFSEVKHETDKNCMAVLSRVT